MSAVILTSMSSQRFFWKSIARSSAYPYFLASVAWRPGMHAIESIGANTDHTRNGYLDTPPPPHTQSAVLVVTGVECGDAVGEINHMLEV